MAASPLFEAVAVGTLSPATGLLLFDAAVEVLVLVSLDLALPLTGLLAEPEGLGWGLGWVVGRGDLGAWVLAGQPALAGSRVASMALLGVGLHSPTPGR